MKQKFIEALRIGQKVNHSVYGVCTVEGNIQDKGPQLTPDSREGLELLANITKKPLGMAFTESQFWLIKHYKS